MTRALIASLLLSLLTACSPSTDGSGIEKGSSLAPLTSPRPEPRPIYLPR